MIIYIINILLLIVFGLLFLGYKPNLQNKKIFCFFATTQWIIISGLRHVSVGADTLGYKNSFMLTDTWSWDFIIDRFNQGARDPGYAIFEKIAQYISPEYQIFLIIIALLFMIPLGIMIYKYSKNPFISFLIYSVLFYSFFAITGHRQTIATAIALLLGYPLLRDRKIWKYILLVLVAATIHKSALVLIPFYFIANKKITFKYSISMCILFVFVFIFRNQFMQIFGGLLGYDMYVDQFAGAGTPTFTLLFLGIIFVAIWKRKQIFDNQITKDVTIWYNAVFVGLLFVPLTYIDPSAMRVVQYFSIFIIFLIPELIKTLSPKEQPIVYYVISVVLVLLLIRTNPQYSFFWQG